MSLDYGKKQAVLWVSASSLCFSDEDGLQSDLWICALSLLVWIVSSAPGVYPGVGKKINGNQNWIQLGPIGGSHPELVKIFTLLMMVRYLADIRERPLRLNTIASGRDMGSAGRSGVSEHDTGSTLSYCSLC